MSRKTFDGDSSTTLGVRLKQLPRVVQRAARHPTWLAENVRMLSRRRAHVKSEFSLLLYQDLVQIDERTAIMDVLGVSDAEYGQAKARFWSPSVPVEGALWDAREGLQSVVSLVVRLLGPARMVETGVSRGVTSAVALAAMRDLGHGHLYSIDLPPLLVDADEFIGSAVPDELRGRWTLLRGPSRKLLPQLLSELGEIELFLHDADHTYRSQFEELETVWPHLVPGGVILCDDVESRSLTDFAEQHGVSPTLIPFPGGYGDVSPVGLLAKPRLGGPDTHHPD